MLDLWLSADSAVELRRRPANPTVGLDDCMSPSLFRELRADLRPLSENRPVKLGFLTPLSLSSLICVICVCRSARVGRLVDTSGAGLALAALASRRSSSRSRGMSCFTANVASLPRDTGPFSVGWTFSCLLRKPVYTVTGVSGIFSPLASKVGLWRAGSRLRPPNSRGLVCSLPPSGENRSCHCVFSPDFLQAHRSHGSA